MQGQANLALHQEDNAEQLFGEALALHPGNEDAIFGKILLAIRNDRPDEAAALAGQLLEQAPDNAKALLVRGHLHLRRGEVADAAGRFAQAMELAPENVPSILSHAKAMVASGDFEAARSDLDRADKIQKGVAPTQYLRGAIAFEERDWERARAHLQRTPQGMPDDLVGQFMLGAASFQLGELEATIDLGQEIPEADRLLILAHIKNKDFDRALQASRALEQRQPDSPVAATLTGLALLAKGDREGARERFSKASALEPGFTDAALELASIDAADGDWSPFSAATSPCSPPTRANSRPCYTWPH